MSFLLKTKPHAGVISSDLTKRSYVIFDTFERNGTLLLRLKKIFPCYLKSGQGYLPCPLFSGEDTSDVTTAINIPEIFSGSGQSTFRLSSAQHHYSYQQKFHHSNSLTTANSNSSYMDYLILYHRHYL